MYRDITQWRKIRSMVLKDGYSQRQVARETGIDTRTISKMVAYSHPQPYGPRSNRNPKLGPLTASIQRLLQENATLPSAARLSKRAIFEYLRDMEGFKGGYSTVTDYIGPLHREKGCVWKFIYDVLISLKEKQAIEFLLVLSRADPPVIAPARASAIYRAASPVVKTPPISKKELVDRDAVRWMLAVQQRNISMETLRAELRHPPDLECLLQRLYDGRLSDRNRAMVVLAKRYGHSCRNTCAFLGINNKTYRRYLGAFERGGAAALFARQTKSSRKFDDQAVRNALFGILHQPPANYGINRTTWTMTDLCRILRETGQPACKDVIRTIIKTSGYRWRKARVVLTSRDPSYTEKLNRIRSILSQLDRDEAFFSIDEYGPFAVKAKGGRGLTAPGEQRTVPQWQKSRGCIIITAALELSTNQVTHFYSAKKNTTEMIRMMDTLVKQYRELKTIYLSWDAASWHISKRLYAHIEAHNLSATLIGGPQVDTAPLPAGAQFLNVIESVFSGMARAIIHNSDYRTVDDAKAAINRYIDERNAHFKKHPRRAGNNLWRKEREPAAFSEGNNCKDPRYR
jgi:transposase